jgi:hypothetical protein
MDRCPNCNHPLPPRDHFTAAPDRDREAEMRARSVRKRALDVTLVEDGDGGEPRIRFERPAFDPEE